jgi:hypothetical protein
VAFLLSVYIHKKTPSSVKEREGGYIAINPKFDKLITSLRTAVERYK